MNSNESDALMPSGDTSEEPLWSISAVSRSTGLSTHTLRAWERRFGVPKPVRLTSHHRRYTHKQVEHLQLVARALSQGHRAGDVVPLSTSKLRDLLAVVEIVPNDRVAVPAWLEQMMQKALNFDREGLFQKLKHDASRMGVEPFVYERIVPLIIEVGRAWQYGEIGIRHEHFVTEILEDTLRHLRMPLESKSRGAPVLLATLPGELHGLGLQIVALLLTLREVPFHVLGTQTPLEDIVAACEMLQPKAVGLTITPSTADEKTVEKVDKLRDMLPMHIGLWLGGAGATMLEDIPTGTQIVGQLEDLELLL